MEALFCDICGRQITGGIYSTEGDRDCCSKNCRDYARLNPDTRTDVYHAPRVELRRY